MASPSAQLHLWRRMPSGLRASAASDALHLHSAGLSSGHSGSAQCLHARARAQLVRRQAGDVRWFTHSSGLARAAARSAKHTVPKSSATSTASPASRPLAPAPGPDRTFDKVQLEKPAKYNGPSHAASNARQGKTYIYGGDLTAGAKAAQAKKQYPHMMPPEGSWTHWLLNSRKLHTGVALVR